MKKPQGIEKPISLEFRLYDLNYLLLGSHRPRDKHILHKIFQHFNQDPLLAQKLAEIVLKYENPNEYDRDRWTPLQLAVRFNQVKGVKFAQEHGKFNFHLTAGPQEFTLMHLAVAKSNYEIIEILIEEKVSMFQENAEGVLPRKLALQSPTNLKMIKKYENKQILRFLIDLEDIDDEESTQANQIKNLNISLQQISDAPIRDVNITRPKVSMTYHILPQHFHIDYLNCERFIDNTLNHVFNDSYAILLLIAISNQLFPKTQLCTLIEMSNIPIPRLSYDDFDLDDKLEQYSKILKKKLIYDIEDYRLKLKNLPNIFEEPKNQESIQSLKRFTSNKLAYDIKNYASGPKQVEILQRIQSNSLFALLSFQACGFPKIKYQSNHLLLHQFEYLNQFENNTQTSRIEVKLNSEIQNKLQLISSMNKSQEEAIQKNHYGKLEYWERRYSENDKPFEWYQNFDNLKDIVTQHITQNSRILNIGCGNSNIPEDMYKEGYQWITNLDFSKVAIQYMSTKYKDYPAHFKFVLADARELPFDDDSFDCVFDKGLLDAILSGDYSAQNSRKVIKHIHRILQKKSGVYIVVSHGFPEQRLPYLNKTDYNWHVTVHKVYKPDVRTKSMDFDASDLNNYHFIYVCKMKGQTAAQILGI